MYELTHDARRLSATDPRGHGPRFHVDAADRPFATKRCHLLQTCPCGTSFDSRKRTWCSLKCRVANARHNYRTPQQRHDRTSLMRAFADAAKAGGCVDCGNKNLSVLQLDHVRGQKYMAISELIHKNVGWAKFFAELDKCETRCANCHQLKTAERSAA